MENPSLEKLQFIQSWFTNFYPGKFNTDTNPGKLKYPKLEKPLKSQKPGLEYGNLQLRSIQYQSWIFKVSTSGISHIQCWINEISIFGKFHFQCWIDKISVFGKCHIQWCIDEISVFGKCHIQNGLNGISIFG